MIRVTTLGFQEQFAALIEKAQLEPVRITREGRDLLVVVAAEEYARLMRRARQLTVGIARRLERCPCCGRPTYRRPPDRDAVGLMRYRYCVAVLLMHKSSHEVH